MWNNSCSDVVEQSVQPFHHQPMPLNRETLLKQKFQNTFWLVQLSFSVVEKIYRQIGEQGAIGFSCHFNHAHCSSRLSLWLQHEHVHSVPLWIHKTVTVYREFCICGPSCLHEPATAALFHQRLYLPSWRHCNNINGSVWCGCFV